MKKIFSTAVLAAFLLLAMSSMAQGEYIIRLNSDVHGTVLDMQAGSYTLRDDDSQGPDAPDAGSYEYGKDYFVTIKGGCSAPGRLCFKVDELSVSCIDTIYVYEGPDTNGNLLIKFNNFTNNVTVDNLVYESPNNTTGMLTVRFRTDPRTDASRTQMSCYQNNGSIGKGFSMSFFCGIPCERVIPVIDSMFYRTRHGVVYDSAYTKEIVEIKTIYVNEDDTSQGVDHYDTVRFIGANLCIGDGVIFRGHGDYTYNYGYYIPADSTTFFRWDLANEGDTMAGYGLTEIEYNEYQRTGCFDIRLDLVDSYGCTNDAIASVKVRTALNPIKTIYTLDEICSNDSLPVNMGYDGENATLTLKRIINEESVSKTYEVRTFIPDGCNCTQPNYFEAPVEFVEFPNNRRVTSAKDICSICINMEHSFMGDIYITIVCPTGNEAVIKWGNPSSCTPSGLPSQAPTSTPQGVPIHDGRGHGSGTNLGFPLDGAYVSGPADGSPACDSLPNPFGIGLDYCFSRDTHYTLVTGQNAKGVWSVADPNPTGNFYIVSSGYTDNLPVTFPPVPAGYNQAGQTPVANNGHINTKHPSDHENKLDYYLPFADFSELVGCPLNGNWKIRVYDCWGADNGWIFNWSLDICNVTMDDDCDYTVGIDSLIWRPRKDSLYCDYDLGHYRGAMVHQSTPTESYIYTPDTAGTFPIDVYVYDEFGCIWDTNTSITSHWAPEPNLGPDTALCGSDTIILDATDRHSDQCEDRKYIWSPFGQNTPTISSQHEPTGDIRYEVEVVHKYPPLGTKCSSRDTVNIALRRQPLPNFTPTPFVFEGCDPFTISFDNQSVETERHLWVFGDGVTSTLPNPTHTYAAGLYDLKYYAYSADGCVDSIISPQSIAVYEAPQAAFAWDPIYPSVLNPVVTLENRTTPKAPENKYFWEVQYNPENPRSVHTVTDENPVFNFSQYVEDDPSGIYAVRLIARTDNLAPSGNMVYCRDTAENTILLVNDFLQFPNVVTPNGDGINDRFVIQNLVSGNGYPTNVLDIYNKWGTHVYHKENISKDEDFWDPKDMPAGTYFYRFSARGYNGNIEHNGAIEVVK